MFATAALSMWISNTATTIMMMAIAMSITEFLNQNIKNPNNVLPLNKALMLSIAYAASIGGTATLIGTPPNLFFASFLEDQYNITIDMLSWMKIGVPFMLIMLPTAWFWLTHVCYKVKSIELPNIQDVLKKESASFKKMSLSELSVVAIFVLTATLWIFKLKINTTLGWSLSDADIALFSAMLLFCLPASLSKKSFLLDWKTAQEIPWGILLMFGGGLSVALSFSATGLTETLANSFTSLSSLAPLLFLASLVLFSLFLTELVTNSAAIATLLPITAAICLTTGLDFLYLAIPITLACSCAFMFPISTPPNAIVFAFKGLRIKDMVKAGSVLNLITVVIITILASIML